MSSLQYRVIVDQVVFDRQTRESRAGQHVPGISKLRQLREFPGGVQGDLHVPLFQMATGFLLFICLCVGWSVRPSVRRSGRPSVVGPSVGLRSMSYPLQFVCLHLVSIVFIFSFGAAVMSSTVVQHHLLVLLYQGLLFSAIWDTRRTASRPISTFSACNP